MSAQIVLDVGSAPPLLAGVPAPLRTALALADHGRVLLCTRAPSTLSPWIGRLAGLPIEEVAAHNGSRPLAERLDAAAPLLLIAPGGCPDTGALLRFVESARQAAGPSTWVADGRALAAYYPRAADCLERLPKDGRAFPEEALRASAARAHAAPAEAWVSLADESGRRRAEEDLYRSLRSESDGYLARLDRRLSIALSRRLVRTPVTPNQITAFSLLVGLLGSALLASGAYVPSVLGAALLWACCVLDGCDGEVARLKLMSSPQGARFDVIADNVVHLAIFAAIPLHLRGAHPGIRFGTPGLVLLSGVMLSMLWVWLLILRRPETARSGAVRVFERIASRDFIYLVAALTVVRRLEWFLWAAAFGAHAFWLSLVALSALSRREAPDAVPAAPRA